MPQRRNVADGVTTWYSTLESCWCMTRYADGRGRCRGRGQRPHASGTRHRLTSMFHILCEDAVDASISLRTMSSFLLATRWAVNSADRQRRRCPSAGLSSIGRRKSGQGWSNLLPGMLTELVTSPSTVSSINCGRMTDLNWPSTSFTKQIWSGTMAACR